MSLIQILGDLKHLNRLPGWYADEVPILARQPALELTHPRARCVPACGYPRKAGNYYLSAESRSRPCAAPKSRRGPAGTIPVGLMERWL